MLIRFHSCTSKSLYKIVTKYKTWIYQCDPQTKSQSSVWLFQNETPPTKLAIDEKIVAIFFYEKRPYCPTTFLRAKNIAIWYTDICLPETLKNSEQKRPKTRTRGVLLQNDTASAHSALKTKVFLKENKIQLEGHPPYSLEFSPCNFYLFFKIKERLRRAKFLSMKNL